MLDLGAKFLWFKNFLSHHHFPHSSWLSKAEMYEIKLGKSSSMSVEPGS